MDIEFFLMICFFCWITFALIGLSLLILNDRYKQINRISDKMIIAIVTSGILLIIMVMSFVIYTW